MNPSRIAAHFPPKGQTQGLSLFRNCLLPWLRTGGFIVALVLVLLGSRPGFAQPTSNDCTDPYWADTLRCALLPDVEPQPAPEPPGTPAAIKEFTRVNLVSDWGIRCLDGTRPVLYVDPAVSGDSNKWIISFTGGGSCNAVDTEPDGIHDDGQDCLDSYLGGEAGEMGTAGEPSTKNLGSGGGSSNGINKPDVALNPVFSDYHRVRVEKCSYDRFNGRATHESLAAVLPNSDLLTFDLFQHGKEIVEMALGELRGDVGAGQGLVYTTWENNGGTVVPFQETLPPLESAERILLVGHSGGAHGLMHNVDAVVDFLLDWPSFGGDVRAVLDANFLPAMENEVAFDSGQSGDLYDHSWAGTTPEVGAYDGSVYFNTSSLRRQYDAWMANPSDPLSTMFDTSCLQVHGPLGDAWKCRDRFHVLFNHLTTPLFLREDFNDPNKAHTWNGQGHRVNWGSLGSYPHCGLMGYDPCPPLLTVGHPSPYRDRLEQQYETVLGGFTTRSELALGEDTSGSAPSIYFWMPDCGSHAGTYSDFQFYDTEIRGLDRWTLRELLEDFVLAPAVGATISEIDGLDARTSHCPGLVFQDGFESADTTAWSATQP